MDEGQQKEFITMLESIKVPCDYDMDCSEMKALFEIYIMNKKNKNKDLENMELEIGEDTTKYGEFISSYFAWVSLPKQKEKVEKLENITKNKDKERN